MDLTGILAELRERLAHVEESIFAMERLASTKGIKRRGRQPAWLKEKLAAQAPKKRPARPRKLA